MNVRKLNFSKPSSGFVVGILQVISGALLTLLSTVLFLFSRLMENLFSSWSSVSRVFFLILCAGILLALRGIWNNIFCSRLKKLDKAMDKSRTSLTVDQLAGELDLSPAYIRNTIERSINRRNWRSVGISEKTILLESGAGASHTVRAGEGMRFREEKRGAYTPWAWFGGVWFFYLLIGFSAWYDFIIAGAISLVVYGVLSQVYPKRSRLLYEKIPALPVHTEKVEATGNPQVDDILTEAAGFINELAALDRAITDPKIDAQVHELLAVTRQIFDLVKKSPEKGKQIREFMNYYLPTTIKLLRSYDELSRVSVKGDNIRESMSKIEGIVHDLLQAYHKQLDDLYRDKNIDIGAEIAVMENMIQKQGFDLMNFTDKL